MGKYAIPSDVAEYLHQDESSLPSSVERLIDRAEELVDFATMNRVDVADTTRLALVQKAVCAQVEYWIENGESASLGGAVKSKQVGKVSVTYATSDRGGDGSGLCERAWQLLMQSGLLYRGALLK